MVRTVHATNTHGRARLTTHDFPILRFSQFHALNYDFRTVFNHVFTNASQSLKPLKFYNKTMFFLFFYFISKQLDPIRSKQLISQKCLKQFFTQKSNFHPNDSSPKHINPKQNFYTIQFNKNNSMNPFKTSKSYISAFDLFSQKSLKHNNLTKHCISHNQFHGFSTRIYTQQHS